MTKKIFAISTLVLVLAVGAIFVYNFAFKKPAETTVTDTSQKASDEGKTASPASSQKQADQKNDGDAITVVSETAAFGATLAPDTNFIYYFSGDNGQLNEVGLDGKLEKVVSTEQFQDIEQVVWNKQKNRVILKREDGPGKSKYLLLDLTQKAVLPLKDNVDSVAWSGLGDKIIYKHYDPTTKKRTLNISDPDGSNWRKIADISYFGVSIAPAPGTSDISFWPNPDAFVSTYLNLVSFNGKDKKEIIRDRFGADFSWSPDGKKILVSYTDQKGGKRSDLALANAQGGEFHSIGFPTFAKKCAWSADSNFLYCALPGNIPESSVLPNDWQEGKIQTTDTFWKVEAATGKKERLIESDKISGSFDVLAPFLSADEKTLFFVNKVDGKLYKLSF